MLRGLLEIAEGPEAIVFEIKQPLRGVEWLFGPDGAMGWTRGSIGVRTAHQACGRCSFSYRVYRSAIFSRESYLPCILNWSISRQADRQLFIFCTKGIPPRFADNPVEHCFLHCAPATVLGSNVSVVHAASGVAKQTERSNNTAGLIVPGKCWRAPAKYREERDSVIFFS